MVDVQSDAARGRPGRLARPMRPLYLDEALRLLSSRRRRGSSPSAASPAPARRPSPGRSRRGIGAAPGAVHLRSDLERKALLGRAPTARLPAEGYSPGRQRGGLPPAADRARTRSSGPATRAPRRHVPRRCRRARRRRRWRPRLGAPFAGLWLEARRDVLLARVEARRVTPRTPTRRSFSASSGAIRARSPGAASMRAERPTKRLLPPRPRSAMPAERSHVPQLAQRHPRTPETRTWKYGIHRRDTGPTW